AVIVTGGHGTGEESIDVFFDGREFIELRTARVATRGVHGTGCAFAAAVASGLAFGFKPVEAARLAQAYVAGATRHARAIEPLALRVFGRISDEARERWPGVRVALHHRIGRLQIGEASVAIAAASAHRADAFAAARYAIERVKQIAPIWKHEFFEGGDVWIEGATADPDDSQARSDAERVACA